MTLPAPADEQTMAHAKQRALKEIFGFESFRDGQEEIIDALLDGHNVLAVMPTGAGKSLCFQIPALVKGGLTLVVSPLVALMQDQVAALKLAGVAADTINSSRDRAENVAVWRRVEKGEISLLYLSPERLMSGRMTESLGRADVRLVAIDEAHCISRWGPAFRPEYALLSQLPEVFPDVPIAALTASADAATRDDIVQRLFDGAAERFVSGFDRPNISLAVEIKSNWKRQLAAFVAEHKGESGIVYCLSRKKTEEAAALLCEQGVNALPYHAGMDKAARQENQNRFMTEPGLVVVATIAFGMGIDKADVRYVVHTDLPASVEAYYQEFGRAGRDGAPAVAHMLYGLDDIDARRRFIEADGTDDAHRMREHKRLDVLIAYCESPTCRRVGLLAYFGETAAPCGNCDMCLEPAETADGGEDGRKALSAVYRTGQRFGMAHIIDILRGAETAKMATTGHDQLPTFGVGKDRSKIEWRSIIRQLVAAGFLRLDVAGYGGLALTEKGVQLLKGDIGFAYRVDALRTPEKPERKTRTRTPPPSLDGGQAALLDALKALRLELARAREVPAYVIFSDKSLIDMVLKAPATHEDFAEVHGVGEAKLRDLAEPFLAAIAAHREGAMAD